jgi:hypothetical protein
MLIKWLGLFAIEAANGVFERERARWSHTCVEGVNVYGSTAFVEDVNTALCELRDRYSFGYSLVRRYIRAIVESEVEPSKGTPIGVVYRVAYNGGGLGVPPNWFAAALVRRAAAMRKLISFQIWRSSRSALGSLSQEIKAIDRLECDGEYRHRQLNKLLSLERELRRTSSYVS